MDQVAVLGVLQAEERAVRGQRAAQEPSLVDAAEANRLGRAVDLAGRRSIERDVHGEPVAVAESGGDDARRLGEPLAPAVRDAVEERARSRRRRTAARASGPTRRRSRPGTRGRLRRRASASRRSRPTGSSVTWRRVPVSRSQAWTCQTPGLVRRVHDALRARRRPLGKERDGRAEALLPGLRGSSPREANSRAA